MVTGGQATGQTGGGGVFNGNACRKGRRQCRHFVSKNGFEQFGLVLEVGENSTGRHTGTLGDVADGGGVIAAFGKQGAGGFKNLYAGAGLGDLTAVYAWLGFAFFGGRGNNERLGHRHYNSD